MLDYAREHGLGMCIYDGNTVVCGTDVDRYIERETVLNGFNRVSVENFDAYRGMDMFKALLTAPPRPRGGARKAPCAPVHRPAQHLPQRAVFH